MKRLFYILISVFALNFCCLTSTYADAGLPMIVIAWPIFWLAFIPIVFIEWIIVIRRITEISRKYLLFVITIANLCSTLIGIPLAWLIMFSIEFLVPGGTGTYSSLPNFYRYLLGVTLQAPWLLPYESDLYWMIPTAFIVLLVPFFLISYWLEALVTIKLLQKTPTNKNIKHLMWQANIASYACLLLVSIIFLLYQIYAN